MKEMTIALYRHIRGDYAPRNDCFNTDSDRVAKLKHAIARLSLSDQAIILLYCEDRSLRKLADRFDVSVAYMHKAVTRIKNEIKRKL